MAQPKKPKAIAKKPAPVVAPSIKPKVSDLMPIISPKIKAKK